MDGNDPAGSRHWVELRFQFRSIGTAPNALPLEMVGCTTSARPVRPPARVSFKEGLCIRTTTLEVVTRVNSRSNSPQPGLQ
jgi:hypothetical protein